MKYSVKDLMKMRRIIEDLHRDSYPTSGPSSTWGLVQAGITEGFLVTYMSNETTPQELFEQLKPEYKYRHE